MTPLRIALACALLTAAIASAQVSVIPAPAGGGGGGGNVIYCTGSASATAATCAGSPVPITYTGLTGFFVAGATSTGAPLTLNIASLGAKNVYLGGSATSTTNTVISGQQYPFYYDGTQIQLTSETSISGAFAAAGGFNSGTGSGLNGLDCFSGSTSGKFCISTPNVAGTAITMLWPATNGVANQVLSDSGVVTCPTNLPAAAPAVCHSLAWVAASSGGGPTTMSIVTGSRASATVYQNTTGSMLYVSIRVLMAVSSAGSIYLTVGASSPITLSATTAVSGYSVSGSGTLTQYTFFAMVPNNYYYSLDVSSALSPALFTNIQTWAEWN